MIPPPLRLPRRAPPPPSQGRRSGWWPPRLRENACFDKKIKKRIYASSGNRTRAARVAGEHSTTEPTMLRWKETDSCEYLNKVVQAK